MFGSAILEMTIGLILIFLLFSLIMTAAREALEGILRTRANNLQKALTELLGPPGDQMSDDKSATDKALQAFHEHPLIYALYKGNKIKMTLNDAGHYRTPRDARVKAFKRTGTGCRTKTISPIGKGSTSISKQTKFTFK